MLEEKTKCIQSQRQDLVMFIKGHIAIAIIWLSSRLERRNERRNTVNIITDKLVTCRHWFVVEKMTILLFPFVTIAKPTSMKQY